MSQPHVPNVRAALRALPQCFSVSPNLFLLDIQLTAPLHKYK